MNSVEDEEFAEDFFPSEKKKQKMKDDILDSDFKKATVPGSKKDTKKMLKKPMRKKPFLRFGIILILIAVVCIIITNLGPWLYVGYEIDDEKIEELYYRDFDNKKSSEDLKIHSFFQNLNSSKYLGITIDDFSDIPRMDLYIFFSMIILGLIFTIIEIANHWRKFSLITRNILHTFFALLASILCIFFMFVNLKFFSASILAYHNAGFIESNIPNANFVFLTPIILVFITAIILKISFSVMKLNFKEFEIKMLTIQPKKSLFNYRYRGKNK